VNAPGARSKLTVVVAVDLAGYAAMTETDQGAAVAEVAALRRQVADLAEAHGGRLFHAAGDGFMAEFGSASAALDFARRLAGEAHAPIRIGVHLGEVAETSEGDLLGHGVNVAARLQERARPGQALISADVRRALPGGHAEGLKRVGVIRLDKMSQRIETFALGDAQPVRRRRNLWPWAAGAAAALVLLAVGSLAWQQLGPTDRNRVIFGGFVLADAPAAPAGFVDDLRTELVGEMTRNELGVAAGRGSVFSRRPAFRVSGGVGQDGGTLRVDVRVDDAREGVSLWSGRFEAPAAEAGELRQQVAINVTDVLKCSKAPGLPSADVETLRLYLMICERVSGDGADPAVLERRREMLRRLVQRAPNFAQGRALLANAHAFATLYVSPAEAKGLEDEARKEAERALELDPKNADAYLALTQLHARRDWQPRGVWVAKALELAPDSPSAQAAWGNFLSETGLVEESAVVRARAQGLDPLSPGRTVALAYALSNMGVQARAEQLAARATAAWPSYRGGWQARVRILSWGGDFAAAQAVLAQRPAYPGIESEELERWRDLIDAWSQAAALPEGPARAPWIRRLAAIAAEDGVLQADAVQALAAVASPAETWPLVERHLGQREALTLILFNPPFQRLQKDPAFMDIAAKTGLAQYWLASGRMPDFCKRALPYDCAAEARRAVKQPGALSLAAGVTGVTAERPMRR
jgi:adenylate cyclase